MNIIIWLFVGGAVIAAILYALKSSKAEEPKYRNRERAKKKTPEL